MCNSYTESGKPCHFDGCESYKLIQAALTAAQLRYGDLELETARIRSDRDRLAGVVAGMDEQNARNLDTLRRAEAENAILRAALDRLACRSNRITSNFRHGRQSEPDDFTRLCNAQFEAEKVLSNALKEVGQ